ncbi:MAG: hypothetical protein GF398_12680 [Chitinivibrionales bacterium]|nr:hypothetical protein [Chitinivibrionales bacterium]
MIQPKKCNGIVLLVQDFDESMAWYKEHFGFQRIYGTPQGVVIGNDHVEIVLAQVDNESAQHVELAKKIGIKSFGFEITRDELIRVEAEFPELDNVDKREHPRFQSRIITDPDGHLIELYVKKRV